MNAYTGLAERYDGFTGDVRYDQWCSWASQLFRQEQEPVELILDLGCGTGTLTCLMAQQGFEMMGVDGSSEMLSQAMSKAMELELEPLPMLLCQDMAKLRLWGQVDGCISSLDSLNYLTEEKALRAAIQGAAKYLRPNGLFLFDMIPLWEFCRRDGQIFLDENEDTLCIWRASFEEDTGCITYGMDIFHTKNGRSWTREQEEHQERGWPLDQVRTILEESGFQVESLTGTDRLNPPAETDDRVYFVCRKRSEE